MEQNRVTVHAEGQVQPSRWLPLWFGLLGGQAAWTLQLLVSYYLVSVACLLGPTRFEDMGFPDLRVLLNVVTAVAALIALAAGAIAYREWRQSGTDERRDLTDPNGQRHFLALVGILLSGLYVVVILLVGTSHLFINPFADPGCVSRVSQ